MKRIRLTESDLHRMIKESVKSVINEIGDTRRGQWMLGRLAARNNDYKIKNGDNGNHFSDDYISNYAKTANDGYFSDDFYEGGDDFNNIGQNYQNNEFNYNNYKQNKFKYDVKQMQDDDDMSKVFINFIENNDQLLQMIVDYESGNQTGTPESPIDEIIDIFEENVLGYEISDRLRNTLSKIYYGWWYYAQDHLMQSEEY